MPKTYARFAAAPIGPNLVARDGGLTLTSVGAAPGGCIGRSDISFTAGTHGVEFVFWGDDALVCDVGMVPTGAAVNSSVGAVGYAWLLHAGKIHVGGVEQASGLPAVAKGDTIGVRVELDGGAPTVRWYHNGTLVHSREITAGSWHFGVSMATSKTGGLVCAVNAGQWGFASAAAQAGWYTEPAAAANAKLADEDFLTATTDAPANTPFAGIIGDGLQLVSEVWFWPWGGSPPVQGGAAQITVTDAGALDALALADVRGTPVAIRLGTQGGTLAAASPVARFVLDRVEVVDDVTKTVYLLDAHDDLDLPLTRKQFLPNIPALAWKPQPVVIGAVASVPALPANSDGTVLWLADAPVGAVVTVMDRGDAMEPGTYTLTPDGQQLTMTSPPVGPVVADVGAPATLQQTLANLFGRIGKSSWVSADAAEIDTATGYAGIGYYTAEPTATPRGALAAILPSYGAWHRQNADGTLGLVRIIAPETYAGPLAFDLDGVMLGADIVVVPDDAPNLTRRMAYRPNAQALGPADLVTDLVDVPQSKRDELTSLYRAQVYGGGPLAGHYRHADSADPFVSLFWNAADAQAEIDRVIALYAVQRCFYRVRYTVDSAMPLAQQLPPLVGSIGRLVYDRYGLAAGKKLLVRRTTYSPATGEIELILWG